MQPPSLQRTARRASRAAIFQHCGTALQGSTVANPILFGASTHTRVKTLKNMMPAGSSIRCLRSTSAAHRRALPRTVCRRVLRWEIDGSVIELGRVDEFG